MLATYASLIAVCAASLAIGQAALALCGRRRWSWLAPAVGLALLTALCWGTVRLPGEGVASAVAVVAVTAASLLLLRSRLEGGGEALREGAPVAAAALVAASLPFLVEARFGILGTGLNPDMSQHLLAAERLAGSTEGQLLAQGYPLGPHAIAVALHEGLGVGLVQAFGGLTVAVAVLAALTALAGVGDLRPLARWGAALLVALPYMVASYLTQGAFKETMQALFLLAFALAMWGLSRGGDGAWGRAEPEGGEGRRHDLEEARTWEGRRRGPAGRAMGWLATGRAPPPGTNAGLAAGHAPRSAPPLAAAPLAFLAAGSVYAYSFPGLAWLAGALAVWAVAELALAAREGERAGELLRAAMRPALLALLVFAVLVAPEIGRMSDFADFETFDPDGPGLGNLFNPISPLEAFGVWPSGDFRLDPGDGAAPAWSYWLGALAAAAAALCGLVWWCRRREVAVPAALAAAGLLFAYAHWWGTPYQEAKAVALAAPLAMLVTTRALLHPPARPGGDRGRRGAGLVLALAAATSSLAVLANGPVGPASHSTFLAELRPLPGSTLVLAPGEMLDGEHGRSYLVWELRGGRVCVQATPTQPARVPRRGISQVVTVRSDDERPPFPGLVLRRREGDYALWDSRSRAAVPGPCPLISTGQRADPGDG